MTSDITINQLDPNTFEYQTYMSADENLIASSDLDTVFSSLTDYIEYYIYDQNQTLIYPFETVPLVRYDIRKGDVILNPVSNLEDLGFDVGSYNILYSFYRKRLSSNVSEKYFISEISSDRTEIRLDSNIISNELIISSTNDFIEYRETAEYFVDFYLNFGNNQTIIANNIKLETDENLDPTVLVKLYEPLPTSFDIKDELWVVELLSKPQAYEINFVFEPEIEQDFTYIQGPNYSLDIVNQTATSGEQFSYSTLVNSDITSSINQIQSLLNEKEVNININYEDYNNFVNFSSAKTRLENFYYKVGLIESYTNELSNFLSQITSDTTTTLAYSSSKAQITGKIDGIIKNFDGYEYFLYFNSGSQYSYPKQNTEPPFQLYSTGSTEALTWIGSTNINDPYYGGQALSASNYDQNNRDWLYWSLPEYLREDSANQKYELFIDMVGQYYDNVWVYTKDISNKFDADNRLSYGISKDLVADAIKDFGVKLYSNNFNTDDLFTAFLGLTPSGSSFPFPNITGSLPVESGYEYVDTKISASNDIVPQDDINKSLYKRIYHNIPYLLKTKGTVAGLRALITSYGIPDTILRISEFGGKDRNEAQDYDLKQDVFNYAFDTGENATNYLTSPFDSNPIFPGGDSSPKSIQFRFKSAPIPLPTNNVANGNIRYAQSLWSTDDGGNIVLEYTGSGFTSGSYPGSIPSPYDNYGTLKFIPAGNDDPSLLASLYLPFFNEDWWSIQVNINTSPSTSTLFAANEIDGKIGFTDSDVITGFDSSYYTNSSEAYLNYSSNISIGGTTYKPFSGSFQELRYWTQEISQSNFYDFTVNPYSIEGNGVNGTPSQLYFRAALGTQLNTGSRTSTHPRITGSATQITSSFDGGNSSFTLNGENWVTNVENIFQDQVPAGIKNRITNKIQTENLILAESPYGISGSVALISNQSNDTTTISALKSIQQQSFVSQSYTPNVNYLEVGFSPTNQINDDINAQLGYFNLGDYIGDPRFISSSDTSYPDLDRLRDAYFEKYMASYDIVDFIRLIKFFDNSLFKMIKDFTPARTSLASGVVVKQHLLERNRQRPAQVESSTHDYEGLVVNLPKDYNSGSVDQPQYSTSGSAIYKFSGGAGGIMNKYNGLQTSPSSSAYGLTNQFGPLTQSYEKTLSGPLGQEVVTIFNQDELYNGVFNGSDILVQNGDLNPGCEPYLNISDTPIIYKPIFFNVDTNENVINFSEFENQLNPPPPGHAWIASKTTNQPSLGIQQVSSIKLSKIDAKGNEVTSYLDDFKNLRLILEDATLPYNEISTEYFITGRTQYTDHILLQISQTQGNNFYQDIEGTPYFPITSSATNGGSMDWSLTASTSFTTLTTVNTESSDSEQQGVFLNPTKTTQEQNIYFWNNGNHADALGFFNTGSASVNTTEILTTSPTNAAYTIPYTPNIPWYIEAEVSYSASLNTPATTTNQGIYHSGSSYLGSGLTNQNFTFGITGAYKMYTKSTGFSTISAAQASDLPENTDYEVFFDTQIFGNLEAIYPDASLTGFIDYLIPDKYYKFSNLDGTSGYIIVYITANGTTNLVAQSGNFNTIDDSTGIPVVPTTLFRPSPKTVSGLGDILFNDNNYNTQIPGNSGSGTPTTIPGGHPKVHQVSTSSMLWDFSELTLAGTPPTLTPGTPTFVPFSGSDALTDNTDFLVSFSTQDWFQSFSFLNYTGGSVPNMGATYDGSIKLDVSSLEQSMELTSQDGWEGRPWYLTTIKSKVNFDIYSTDTSDSFSVRVVAQPWNGSNTLGTAIPLSPTINSINGVINVNNLQLSDFTEELPGNPSNNTPYVRIFFEIKNNGDEDIDYIFELDSFKFNMLFENQSGDLLEYPASNSYTPAFFGVQGGGGLQGTIFQASSIAKIPPGSDFYNTAIVDAYLKRTGSQGDFIITSSVFDGTPGTGYSGSIYSGSVIKFGESPIRAFNPFTFDENNNPSSSIAQEGDMYYVEYSMSNFVGGQIGGVQQTTQDVAFQSDNIYPIIEITQSTAGGGSSTYDATGSVILRRGNALTNTSNVGDSLLTIPFNTSDTATGTAIVSGSYNGLFNASDIHRFSIALNKENSVGSGIVVTGFTASIFPSQSIWSPLQTPSSYGNYKEAIDTDFIVPTYYGGDILPFNLSLDCQPLLNNYNEQRSNTFLMDVDYSSQSGPIIPINQKQILLNSAVKATVPDSNYTSLRSINPRYNGVKSTSAQLNVWNVGDTGTFGKLPTIELRDAFFGYFNDLDDPYPNINGLTRVNLNYLIDEQGNALPPSLEPLAIDTFKSVFPNTTLGKIAAKSGESQYKTLGDPAPIERIMQYVSPVIYSQNSSNNYTTVIPLSGSGYISRYDNDDNGTVKFGKFAAMGSASISTILAKQTVDYYLDPSEAVTAPSQGNINVWDAGSNVAAYYNPTPWGTAGDDLDNSQIISLQTSFVTSFISETKGVADELEFELHMYTGSQNPTTEVSFNLEDIECKVYTEDGKVTNIGSVLDYGWFKIINNTSNQTTRRWKSGNWFRKGKWVYSVVQVPVTGIKCTVDWEMYETLFNLGLMRERTPKGGAGVLALEWVITANSGKYTIKVGDEINWRINGSFKNARRGYKQGYFFPIDYEGVKTSVNIQGQGAYDHLLSEANTAQAPFWVYTGSAGTGTNILDQSILVMSSSNMNEAYGTTFRQGEVEYFPGPSDYFPGGVEPKTTNFDPIQYTIELKEGDEIRFANNENFTYRIIEVFAPSENVEGGTARLKVKLDRPVDISVNKDFFLVRRPIVNPNSLYLDTPFPYATLSSASISTGVVNTGSTNFGLTGNVDEEGNYTASYSDLEIASTPGILYPDFPTEYLVQSASIIVNDLISKGIIES